MVDTRYIYKCDFCNNIAVNDPFFPWGKQRCGKHIEEHKRFNMLLYSLKEKVRIWK